MSLFFYYPHWISGLFVSYVVGVRQASMYDLLHEAVHNKLHSNARMNKALAWLFCIFPFLHHPELYSAVQWRRMHRLHHLNLMTDNDPNYIERKLNGEADQPIEGKSLAWLMLSSVWGTIRFCWAGKQDYIYPDGEHFEKRKYPHWRMLFPIPGDSEMNQELALRWCGYLSLFALISISNQWFYFFLFWLLPMYTVLPAVLKFMDFMDHNWSDTSGDLQLNTNSRQVPLWRHFGVSDCHRFYHLEHHTFPQVPCSKMPDLHQLLQAELEVPND
jgi:fatty acid desaturase